MGALALRCPLYEDDVFSTKAVVANRSLKMQGESKFNINKLSITVSWVVKTLNRFNLSSSLGLTVNLQRTRHSNEPSVTDRTRGWEGRGAHLGKWPYMKNVQYLT